MDCERAATLFLTGWRIQNIEDGDFDRMNSLRVDIRKTSELCVNDQKRVLFEASFQAGFEEEHKYEVSYDFGLIFYRDFLMAAGELENSCSYNPLLGSCRGNATLYDAVPRGTGFQFLGFALQSFELETNSGAPVDLLRVKVDASSFSGIGTIPYEDYRQNMECSFAGLSDSGFEPYSCTTKSVGIAVDTGWFETANREKDATLWYPANAATVSFAPPPGVVGLVSGFNSFSLTLNALVPAPVESLSAGCFDPRLVGGMAYWDFEGSIMAPQPDFEAYLKCLNGWLRYP